MIAIIHSTMGHSQDAKAATHERIVRTTAARIRESGTEQPGVAEIMRAAGLTHGGFYKHFASRTDLIAEAVDHALTENEPTIERIIAEADDPLAAFADWYVSEAHRDDPASGCGVVALGADVQRAGGSEQEAYRKQVERYLGHLQMMIGEDEPENRGGRRDLSAMVGAVMIARALGAGHALRRVAAGRARSDTGAPPAAAASLVRPRTAPWTLTSQTGWSTAWSRADANGGNRSQGELHRERLKQAISKLSAARRNGPGIDGKEGVDGSSPSEGFTLRLQLEHLALLPQGITPRVERRR